MDEPHSSNRWKCDLDFSGPAPAVGIRRIQHDPQTEKSLYSRRFDFKARGQAEGLESRLDGQSLRELILLAAGHVVLPATHRGREIDLSTRTSSDPVFAFAKWKLGELQLHVAVRPSPPYRDWVVIDAPPRSWIKVTNHENKNTSRYAFEIRVWSLRRHRKLMFSILTKSSE